jgi:hypothetical protein
MIYRDLERWLDAGAWLRRHRAALLHPDALAGHDTSVRLLVEFGELESALTDHLLPDADTLLPQTRALRRIALRTAHLLRATWRALPLPAADLGDDWRLLEETVATLTGPLRLKVAEGFALYGLYPETWLEAAERFARSTVPRKALCIGLRTIGAPLSAVVAAALESAGWEVHALTLRPRGDPFARSPLLAPALEQFLRRHRDAHALLIDEGPGLSGSSLAGTAEALHRLGFPDARITFFPGWNPDAARLLSPAARERWPRHDKWIGDFDESWIASGHLSSLPLQPLDGGRWRALFFDPADYPPVQPQHERRKYLSQERAPRLFKFAGLGPYGEEAWRRAAPLADAGFTPPVHALRHGFLIQSFVPGRPLTAHDCDDALIDRAAAYLAFRQRMFPASHRTEGETLYRMTAWNLKQTLGVDLPARSDRELLDAGSAVAIDGRLHPWEWLATPEGYVKTDAVDHHADHFFPGATDVAWDLAGFAVEFGLDEGATGQWVRRFVRHSGDTRVTARLPWFRLAYLAFHAGYARLAMETMADSPESERFLRRHERLLGPMRLALHALGPP